MHFIKRKIYVDKQCNGLGSAGVYYKWNEMKEYFLLPNAHYCWWRSFIAILLVGYAIVRWSVFFLFETLYNHSIHH